MSQTPPPPPPAGGPPPAAGPPPGAGGPVPGPGGQQKPDNYLVWAILTTIFCCIPFGIVSIVNAAKVDGAWANGDYATAISASQSAKKWAIIAASIGVVFAIVYAFVILLGVFSSEITTY